MDKNIVRNRRLSLVSLVVIVLFGLCFLSYSTKPTQEEAEEPGKAQGSGIKKISANTFDEIYPQLDQEMKQGLEKPVSLVFRNARMESVLLQISKQTGVKIISYKLQDRIDLMHQDVPASKVLHLLSQAHEWTWEAQDHILLVYPGKSGDESKKKTNFEEFLGQLDPDVRAGLDKPVTLVFSNARVDQILQQMTKQIGTHIIVFGIEDRTDMVYQNIPAVAVLRTLSDFHDWIWEKEGNAIFTYPSSLDVSGWKNIDAFFNGLDNPTREKLQKPATLIYSNTEASLILEQLSRQTGIKIISQGLERKINLISQDLPAGTLFRGLCKGYGWNPELKDGIIVVSPFKQEPSQAKEIENQELRRERIDAHRERVTQILEQRNAAQENK